MSTMLAQRHPNNLLCKGHWAGVVAGVPMALSGLGVGAARADDLMAASTVSTAPVAGEPMNSLLGRVAAAVAPPKVMVEQTPVVDGERAFTLGGVSYRWWTAQGASNFGLGIGAVGNFAGYDIAGTPSLGSSSPLLMVGYRYQMNTRSILFADASGVRRFDADTTDRYSTKVGVEWKARSNGLGLDGASRSLTFQLDSGYRMSLKVRRNGIGVYLKGQF